MRTAPISVNEKIAHYNDADYCFITRKEMLPILRIEIDSLIRDGGVYYSVFDKKDDPEVQIVVLYFEDSYIDLMAEIQNVKARLSNYPVLTEFRCYCSDMFEQFNSRQIHSIIMNTLNEQMDLDYLVKSHVID